MKPPRPIPSQLMVSRTSGVGGILRSIATALLGAAIAFSIVMVLGWIFIGPPQ